MKEWWSSKVEPPQSSVSTASPLKAVMRSSSFPNSLPKLGQHGCHSMYWFKRHVWFFSAHSGFTSKMYIVYAALLLGFPFKFQGGFWQTQQLGPTSTRTSLAPMGRRTSLRTAEKAGRKPILGLQRTSGLQFKTIECHNGNHCILLLWLTLYREVSDSCQQDNDHQTAQASEITRLKR